MARILFIATHDWLFARRHLPAVRAARELDLDVVVATGAGRHGGVIEAAGARLVRLDLDAEGLTPLAIWRAVLQIKALLEAHKPAIVQFHGLRPMLAGAIAARLAGEARRVFVVDGLGAVGRGDDVFGRAGLILAKSCLAPLTGEGAHLVFDNPDDAMLLNLALQDGAVQDGAGPHVHILPGAGVDPLIHGAEPMPWMPPLKLAFGSPLLFANGPDGAVEAVTRARAAGADVTLSLIGRACRPGRDAVPEATLQSWSRLPGINWFAPTADVAQVWRQHHVLVLPSRGGDGLPPLMTEAASAGRAILTTDVGGCRSFVRDGIDGLVVQKGDAEALASAIGDLARAPGLVERMGRSARERVLGGYTERHVMEVYKRIWRQMLQREVMA